MRALNALLAALLRGHGLAPEEEGDWLAVEGHAARIGAWIVREIDHGEAAIVQLDVRVLAGDGRELIESCAGVGKSMDEADLDALTNFARNALHVLLAAFWEQDDNVAIETWEVGGERWRALLGPHVVRHSAPDPDAAPAEVEPLIRAAADASALAPGLNWIRWYYCDNKAGAPIHEALLNNEEWYEGLSALLQANWPVTEHYWSARGFLILDQP